MELADFPPEVRRAAQAAGLEPRLAALQRARRMPPGQPSLSSLALRQEIEPRLGSLGMQGIAVEFETE